ncbi:MAG: PsiF family protein [Pseudolabrys sp.]
MLQRALLITTLALVISGGPVLALTTKQKMETCTFGANDQKLQGAPRKAFMSKCMANEAPAKKPRAAVKPKT